MTFKLLTTAAAVAVILPVSAHAADQAGRNTQSQQREIERSKYEKERAEVQGRLSAQDSVAENKAKPPKASANTSGSAATMNDAAPASGSADVGVGASTPVGSAGVSGKAATSVGNQ